MKNVGALIVIICLLSLGACKKEKQTIVVNPCGIDFESTFHFAAIGSDFIAGPSQSPDSTLSYFIEDHLNDVNIEFEENYLVANPLSTTSDLVEDLATDVPECVNLVVVISGPEDVLAATGSAAFRLEYRQLLEAAIEKAGASNRVFTSEIPDFHLAPAIEPGQAGEIAGRIGVYNQIIIEEAGLQEVNVADVELADAIYGAGLGHDPSVEGGNDLNPSELLLRGWGGRIALSISSVVN